MQNKVHDFFSKAGMNADARKALDAMRTIERAFSEAKDVAKEQDGGIVNGEGNNSETSSVSSENISEGKLSLREQELSDAHKEEIHKDAERLNAKVRMHGGVESVADADVRRVLERGERIKGWYNRKTGEVELYQPNIKDVYDAEKTVAGETVKKNCYFSIPFCLRSLQRDTLLRKNRKHSEAICFQTVNGSFTSRK